MNHCCRKIWDRLLQGLASCVPKRDRVRSLHSGDETSALLGWQHFDTGANGDAPCPGRFR